MVIKFMDKIEILGVKIDNVNMEQAADRAKGFLGGKGHMIFTPNPEIIMAAQKNAEFKDILNSADLLLADGIGVVIGAKLLKRPLPERVPGIDFICRLLDSGMSFYLFGAANGIAEAAAEKLRERGAKVVGCHCGYGFDTDAVAADINDKKPDVVLVCLGAPRQERWIYENRGRLNAAMLIGAGGTLDVFSGKTKRAPVIFQKLNLEWLYRGVTDPKRFKRLLVIPAFLMKILTSGK